MAFKFSKSNLPEQLFINNEYVDSKNSKKLTLINPADQKEISNNCPLAGEEDVELAIAAAEAALPAWRKMGDVQRRNIMNKFADLVDTHTEALAELTRINLGAPFEAFGKFEAGLCAEVCYFSVGRIRLGSKHGSWMYDRLLDTMLAGSASVEENRGLLRTGS